MYFFDTYPLVEIYKGNPKYNKYKEHKVITTLLNLMELYHIILKEGDKKIADLVFQKYLNNCVPVTPEIIKQAVEFRLNFIQKTKFRISYIDAIGYVIARKLNIKFLTGDKAFKNLINVEYVK